MTTHSDDLRTGFAEDDRWNTMTGATARDNDVTVIDDAEAAASAPAGESEDALFTPDDSADLERRWSEVQNQFVDDPRAAVESADRLVTEAMQSLSTRFGAHKDSLEEQWSSGGEVDTEELRQALRQYRSFFHRLLAA